MEHIRELAREILPDIIELRRDIHQHPELGRQEFRTAELIRRELTRYGVDELQSLTPTSVIAIIRGKKPGKKCVALRADIDALPLQEDTGLSYSSENPRVMHACGHDMHTSMLLGVGRLLCEHREEFDGTVKLIFQHSEDTLPGGAKELIEHGVLESPRVDAIFGLHVSPGTGRPGTIGIRSGPLSSAVDTYEIEVHGKSGHSSAPHLAVNPLLTACEMVSLLQRIRENEIDPMEMSVFNNALRETIKKQVLQTASGLEAISGCKIDVHHQAAYPACYNNPTLAELALSAIADGSGSDVPVTLEHPMGFSEDFSYYTTLSSIPGMFLIFHVGQVNTPAPLHNAKCTLDDSLLDVGISAMLSCALRFLEQF